MAKRNEGILELLFLLGRKMPWWVSVLLAVVSYLVLHAIAASPAQPPPSDITAVGNGAARGLISVVAMFTQYIVPVGLLIGAVAGLLGREKPAGAPRQRAAKPSVKRAKYEASSSGSDPRCPRCSGGMVQREVRKGPRSGSMFWGCANYPSCKGTLDG